MRRCPGIVFELVTMTTTGENILDRTLDEVGGKGLFVKELDEALRAGRVDLCVHSYKDMPVEDNPDMPVVAVSRREDPRDVLLCAAGKAEADVCAVGCSSLRRKLQLGALLPKWRVRPVRGNVLTRIDKMDGGEFDALVLAAAGIRRLGLAARVSRVFSADEILPAATQGILAVQGRAGEDYGFLRDWCDADAWDAAEAERSFVRALNGGCSAPVAAYAEVAGDMCTLRGLYVNGHEQLFRGVQSGPRTEARQLGERLAAALKEKGEHNG